MKEKYYSQSHNGMGRERDGHDLEFGFMRKKRGINYVHQASKRLGKARRFYFD